MNAMTNIRKFGASAAIVAVMTFGVVSVAGAASVAPHAATSHTTKVISFTGNYSGTISLLINGSKITAKSVHGTGTATWLGKSTMTGSGASSATSQCDPMSGAGSLVGSGSKLAVTIQAKSKGCAAGTSTPTKVTVTGTVKVTSASSGKFKGATGTLSYSGSFTLPSSSGSSTDKFTAKITGKLTVKS